MGKSIATCGHEIESGGISFATNGWTRMGLPCTDFKTYCARCALDRITGREYSGEIEGTEIQKLKSFCEQWEWK